MCCHRPKSNRKGDHELNSPKLCVKSQPFLFTKWIAQVFVIVVESEHSTSRWKGPGSSWGMLPAYQKHLHELLGKRESCVKSLKLGDLIMIAPSVFLTNKVNMIIFVPSNLGNTGENVPATLRTISGPAEHGHLAILGNIYAPRAQSHLQILPRPSLSSHWVPTGMAWPRRRKS